MSLVFPQKLSLAGVLSRSPVILQGVVLSASSQDRSSLVRVERCFRGKIEAGTSIDIRPAGDALGRQVAESMARGEPAPSYALPEREGTPPPIVAGSSYVFFLQNGRDGIHELSAMQAWRAATEADAIQRLC
jgi:hypothetical protein